MSARRSSALVALAIGLAGALATGPALAQFCPSYTASSTNNDNGCAIEAVNGTDPTPGEWAGIFDLVSRGPAAWGDAGPSVPDIHEGCGIEIPSHDVPARFPCEILQAIAMVESGWRQFCVPTTPADQVGGASRTIISFDCGYGVGQVTSGMHVGEDPDFDRERVASDATYNLATGTRILAGKWAATPCVGDNVPGTVEHWYNAVWAYNGLAYSNNPNNPNFASDRGVYDPAVNEPAPYQEKVFGRVEHPTNDLWPSVALAYPDAVDIGGGSSPPTLPEPACAGPTDCVNTRQPHATRCANDPGTGGGGAGSGGDSAATSTGATGAGGDVEAGGGEQNDSSRDASSPSAGGSGGGNRPDRPEGEGGEGGRTFTDNGGDSSGPCDCGVVGRSRDTSSGLLALAGAVLAIGARRARRSTREIAS
jgi:hypothetical protein